MALSFIALFSSRLQDAKHTPNRMKTINMAGAARKVNSSRQPKSSPNCVPAVSGKAVMADWVEKFEERPLGVITWSLFKLGSE